MSLLINKNVAEFRSRYNLTSSQSINTIELLKHLNIITVFKPLSDDFAGMAFKHGDFRFVMINSSHTIGKQNFTICHELYHLFVQENFKSMTCKTEIFNKKDKIEYSADSFATLLLIPEEGLLERIGNAELKRDKILIQTIVDLEQYFKCSRIALLHRLQGLNIISEDFKNQYSTEIMKSAKKAGYTDDLYKKGNEGLFIGEEYIKTIQNLYDKEHISQSHYLDLMYAIGQDKY